MRRILSNGLAAAGLALALGAGWAAPAVAGPADAAPADQAQPSAESVLCPSKFRQDTVVREIPFANSTVIAEIPKGTWADGAWCVPFTAGGNHKTCGFYTDIWVAVKADDTWGFAHTGCMDDYYLH